ncbi:MAG: hypothetical protein ACFFDB_00680 [Promethearchaeota archaeon]
MGEEQVKDGSWLIIRIINTIIPLFILIWATFTRDFSFTDFFMNLNIFGENIVIFIFFFYIGIITALTLIAFSSSEFSKKRWSLAQLTLLIVNIILFILVIFRFI